MRKEIEKFSNFAESISVQYLNTLKFIGGIFKVVSPTGSTFSTH